MFKKLFGRIALYGLAPQIPKFASLFALPIISKYLTPQDYGIAGVITAYVSGFAILQNLGTQVVFSNSFYKSPSQYKWLWRQLHGFLSLWSLLFATILSVLLYWFIIPPEAEENKWVIIILNFITIAFFETPSGISQRFFHLSQKARTLASRTAIIGLLTVGANIFTIAYLKLGYLGWFISNFIGTALSTLFFIYSIYVRYNFRPIFNFKRRTIIKSLKISLPLVPHFYSTYLLNTSDKVLLDLMKVNVNQIGIYNLGGTFGGYYRNLVDAVSTASTPTYLKLYRNGDQASLLSLKRLTFILQAGLLIFSFLLCIWLKEAFQLIIRNKALHSAYPIAIIIIMSYNYRPMYMAALNKLFILEKTKNLWKTTFVAGVGNVVLNLIFLPYFGIMGAAIVTFVTYLYLGYSGFLMKDYKLVKDMNYRPVVWFFLSIATVVSAYFIVDFPILVKVFISLGIFAGLGIFLARNKHLLKEVKLD